MLNARFRGIFLVVTCWLADKKTWVARDSTGKMLKMIEFVAALIRGKMVLDLGPPPLDFGCKGWIPFIQCNEKLVVLGFTFSPSWKKRCKENTSQHLPILSRQNLKTAAIFSTQDGATQKHRKKAARPKPHRNWTFPFRRSLDLKWWRDWCERKGGSNERSEIRAI